MTVGFEQTEFTTLEQNEQVDICISVFNGSSNINTTLALTFSNGSAEGDTAQVCLNATYEQYFLIAGKDFIGQSLEITLAPDQSNACVSVVVKNDLVLEKNEHFSILIETMDSRVIVNPSVSTVTILDDDGMCLMHMQLY